jgi:hypothetical protein
LKNPGNAKFSIPKFSARYLKVRETVKSKKKRAEVPLEKLAEEALKEAVAEVIADHKRTGDPIAILQNGKVVHMPPDQIKMHETRTEYGASGKKRK